MNRNLKELFAIYNELLDIIESEGTNSRSLSGAIQNSISKIEKTLNHPSDQEETPVLVDELARDYNRINQPHTGLSDFFIWKDNVSERIMANKRLEELKEKLRDFFK